MFALVFKESTTAIIKRPLFTQTITPVLFKSDATKRPTNKFSIQAMEGKDWKSAASVYDFKVKTVKGEELSLENYRGKPLIIVNVASQCGLTATNYKELAELYEKYKDSKNLRILGFPCNQFANEEPGTSEDIVCFALSRNAKFDIFEKVNVNGEEAHPLWKYLKHKQGGTLGDAIKWNFTKFIIDKNGQPVERFAPTTPPSKLEETLAKYW